ncbi:GNAT family N-acetyltransferase [Bdellovibrio reynosensis]|uniref:GNAT family N-acetyltransferase n=1 Tax=Bdellovibrio reynosensis TaxID=2835041 RepID=A0ABY4CC08_9BACT|nr:GNAT family N-acetyltransferase [Bdellovibrio reynosensis]UOF01979.1 GNAT family N-acetyltransferase [Bdellovibrio reynosensis]
MNLILRELTPQDESAFFQGMNEWQGEQITWYTFAYKPGMNYGDMLEVLRKEKAGIEIAADKVPHTMLYAFVDGEIVGRVSVRHRLNDHLLQRGGHIGYSVAPRFRKNQYASEMVKQVMPYLRSLGLEKILITCADTNIPSWKIIEKLGAELENKIRDDKGELIRRYWLKI